MKGNEGVLLLRYRNLIIVGVSWSFDFDYKRWKNYTVKETFYLREPYYEVSYLCGGQHQYLYPQFRNIFRNFYFLDCLLTVKNA